MVKPPSYPGSISRPVLVAIAIGVAVIALVAALVWRPLAMSIHLAPHPRQRALRTWVQDGAYSAAGNLARAP
jgi:hypothetical protein